jgi:hypothetical protein
MIPYSPSVQSERFTTSKQRPCQSKAQAFFRQFNVLTRRGAGRSQIEAEKSSPGFPCGSQISAQGFDDSVEGGKTFP